MGSIGVVDAFGYASLELGDGLFLLLLVVGEAAL
jgi:hypothetical protein